MAAAVALAALLATPRAGACTCIGPADLVLPTFDVPAPRSTHVFVALAWEAYCVDEACVRGRSRFALSPVTPGGEALPDVEVTPRFFPNKGRSVYELVPRAMLAADTIHEVWWSDPDGRLRPRILGRFRTGRDVDTTPPTWKGVRGFSFVEPALKRSAIQMCGPFGRRFSFAVQLGDEHVSEPWSPGTTLLGVWMGTDGSSHMNERAPDLVLLHERGEWNPEGWEVVSEDGDCSWNVVPLPPPGSQVHVGVRVLDTSGNASAGQEETYVAPKVPKGKARRLSGKRRGRACRAGRRDPYVVRARAHRRGCYPRSVATAVVIAPGQAAVQPHDDALLRLGLSPRDVTVLSRARRDRVPGATRFEDVVASLRRAVASVLPGGRIYVLGTTPHGPIVGSLVSGIGIAPTLGGVEVVRVESTRITSLGLCGFDGRQRTPAARLSCSLS